MDEDRQKIQDDKRERERKDTTDEMAHISQNIRGHVYSLQFDTILMMITSGNTKNRNVPSVGGQTSHDLKCLSLLLL